MSDVSRLDFERLMQLLRDGATEFPRGRSFYFEMFPPRTDKALALRYAMAHIRPDGAREVLEFRPKEWTVAITDFMLDPVLQAELDAAAAISPEVARGLAAAIAARLERRRLLELGLLDGTITHTRSTDMEQAETTYTTGTDTLADETARRQRVVAEQIAQVCHEANRAYCLMLGDASQPLWPDAPDWQRDSAIHGVLNVMSGAVTKPSDSHESWMREKVEAGWVYGPTKDPAKKEHPCIVPYSDLALSQQRKDALFLAICNTLLGRWPRGTFA